MSVLPTDADTELSELPDLPLTFAELLQAAQRYEQEMAPEFLALCEREPQAWQALAGQLHAGETQHPSALRELDWPDAAALSQALLATPLDLLTGLVAQLKALRGPDEDRDAPAEALATRLLNLLEAHCFGSAPARAPGMLQAALDALQGQPLTPLQALVPDLPQAPELAGWLAQASPARLKALRDACHARLQVATGAEAALLGDWLTALNSSLLVQKA